MGPQTATADDSDFYSIVPKSQCTFQTYHPHLPHTPAGAEVTVRVGSCSVTDAQMSKLRARGYLHTGHSARTHGIRPHTRPSNSHPSIHPFALSYRFTDNVPPYSNNNPSVVEAVDKDYYTYNGTQNNASWVWHYSSAQYGSDSYQAPGQQPGCISNNCIAISTVATASYLIWNTVDFYFDGPAPYSHLANLD